VHSNRNSWPITGKSYRCVVATLATVVSLATNSGAQDPSPAAHDATTFGGSTLERSLDEATRTAIQDSRQLLEQSLTNTNSSVRFRALREARFLDEPWIAGVVLPLCESPSITERNLALEVVAASNPETGREVFLKALIHPHRSIRLRGLLGLERLADPSTLVDVMSVLETDDDPDLKVVAARTLGAIGDINASSALRSAVESPIAPLREQAVLALLAIGKEDVGRYLLRFLENDRQPGTLEALELMALVPDPSLIHLLEPFLASEDPAIRSQTSITILSILERSSSGTR
jgi:HEAT repeat protein